MATQLQVINNVLRRLREDTVSSASTSDYSALIATWINDGVREVTAAYDWSSLRHTIEIEVDAAKRVYDLAALVSGGGDVENTGRVTTLESMLQYDPTGCPEAWLLESSSDTQFNNKLRLVSPGYADRMYYADTSQDVTDPTCFSLTQRPNGENGYSLTLYPVPSVSRWIVMNFWTPPTDMEIDGSDDSTVIQVPSQAVEAYVHMVAANERGEEIGEPGNLLERRYLSVLSSFIEAAMSADQRVNRYESHRD